MVSVPAGDFADPILAISSTIISFLRQSCFLSMDSNLERASILYPPIERNVCRKETNNPNSGTAGLIVRFVSQCSRCHGVYDRFFDKVQRTTPIRGSTSSIRETILESARGSTTVSRGKQWRELSWPNRSSSWIANRWNNPPRLR